MVTYWTLNFASNVSFTPTTLYNVLNLLVSRVEPMSST